MSELIGSELGLYHIEEVLGVGGMSTVFRAYHAALDRQVALKVLPEHMSLDGELRQRFRQEVRIIARLEHAHILPIYDYGQDRGRLYLVLRYIDTGTLEERLVQGPMDLGEVGRVMHQIGPALDHAHRHGVVHRDIKPSNVLIDAQGDCYLSDFGLAKTLENSVRLTSSGIAMGTPAYMSPEQAKGETVDARSDVYSLGAMLFEMTTGRVPFEGNSPTAVALKHITEPPPLPTSVNPALPPQVGRVILRSMAKDPRRRYQTVGEMLEAFNAAFILASQPVALRSEGARGSEPKPAMWGRFIARAALVTLIAVSVLLFPGAFSAERFTYRPHNGGVQEQWTAALSEAGSDQVLASFETAAVPALPSPTLTWRPTTAPTATLPPAPTPTTEASHTPTLAFSPTAAATLTPTPAATSTPAPTATGTATETPTSTPTATATPTRPPAPTPRWLPAPYRLAPDDGATFVGWNADVTLRWSEVEGMLADEYYVVRIPYDDRGGVAEFWRQEPSLEVPPTFSSREVGFSDRRYAWTVQVMRCTRNCARALDDNAKKEGVAVGADSAEGVFYWQPDIGGSPANTTVPIRTPI